jgi:hypothetical protein
VAAAAWELGAPFLVEPADLVLELAISQPRQRLWSAFECALWYSTLPPFHPAMTGASKS